MATLLATATGLGTETALKILAIREFAGDVRKGLLKPQKEIPSKYLYDAVGSALFEAITMLPEYGLTRADERLLRHHAADVAQWVTPGAVVAELGSGSGRKTTAILQAVREHQRSVTYWPIDISGAALEQCSRETSRIPGVTVKALQRSYLDGIREISKSRSRIEHLLVLFLGSSIGNFNYEQAATLLRGIREALRPGDALLVGADLNRNPEDLLKAYDDPAGLTAAFNLNLLSRMNRQLGAAFRHQDFRHEARWCAQHRRMEMHLRSVVRQSVEIPGADCRVRFDAGETIWTESSYKFDLDELSSLASNAGFTSAARWVDPVWPFSNNLWTA